MHTEGNGYTFIEHTADLGIRATATTLPGLFVQAAKGMYALLGRLEPGTEPAEKILQLQAPDAESLLHDWLSELLWELDGNGHLFDSLEFEWLDEQHLTARCRGTVIDAQRSERTVEIKAVTYHDLRIQKRGGLYEVTVIFDI